MFEVKDFELFNYKDRTIEVRYFHHDIAVYEPLTLVSKSMSFNNIQINDSTPHDIRS